MDQESQKLKLENSSCQPENSPVLCANNCGFFGNSQTNNLCSKCYKEFLLNQKGGSNNVVTPPIKVDDFIPVDAVTRSREEEAGATTSEEKREGQPVVVANRCSFCRKRVGLTGFKCRCDKTFCSMHRYSDKHNCVYDYKSAGQDAIAKANPVVKADKIDKI